MSDPPPQEGWAASARIPLIAMATTVTVLSLLLVAAGALYRSTLERQVQPPPVHLPSPRLELTQTPPNLDRADTHQPPPAGIDRAMRETAAEGDRLWQGAKP